MLGGGGLDSGGGLAQGLVNSAFTCAVSGAWYGAGTTLTLATSASIACFTAGRQTASAVATTDHCVQLRLLLPAACAAMSAGSSEAWAVGVQAAPTTCEEVNRHAGTSRCQSCRWPAMHIVGTPATWVAR